MLRLITETETALVLLKARVDRFFADRGGATAIEYGLIAAGIAVAIITAVFALGDDLENFFGGISTELKAKTPGGG